VLLTRLQAAFFFWQLGTGDAPAQVHFSGVVREDSEKEAEKE